MRYVKVFLIIISAQVILFSCNKESSLPKLYDEVVLDSLTGMKIFQLSPDASNVNVFINDKKFAGALSNDTIVKGMNFGAIYPPSLSPTYGFVEYSPTYKFDLYTSLSPLFSKSFANTNMKYYSAYVVDSAKRLDVLLFEDRVKNPISKTSYFRLGNFISNGSIDVRLTRYMEPDGEYYKRIITPKAIDTVWFKNISFKTMTTFDSLPQKGVYKAILYRNNTSVALDSITTIPTINDYVLTIFTRGVMGQTGSSNTKRPLIYMYVNK